MTLRIPEDKFMDFPVSTIQIFMSRKSKCGDLTAHFPYLVDMQLKWISPKPAQLVTVVDQSNNLS